MLRNKCTPHFITQRARSLPDTSSLSLKNASPTKQEAARLEVENAEDDLVQKTEVAITLMKTVLDNVRHNNIIDSLSSSLICLCPAGTPQEPQ